MQDYYNIRFLNKEEIAEKTYKFTFTKPVGYIYEPGQFAKFSLKSSLIQGNGLSQDHNHYFSLFSSPNEKDISIITRIRGSFYKEELLRMTKQSELILSKAMGKFVFGYKDMLFIVGGIGISPVISILDYYYKKDILLSNTNTKEEKNRIKDHDKKEKHDVLVLWANRNCSFLPHDKKIKDTLSNFDFWHFFSDCSLEKDSFQNSKNCSCEEKIGPCFENNNCICDIINDSYIKKALLKMGDNISIYFVGSLEFVNDMKEKVVHFASSGDKIITEGFTGYDKPV